MTRIGDSERALRQQGLLMLAVAVIAVLATGTWAALPPPGPALPKAAPSGSASSGDPSATGIDAATWQVSLWRPFSDAPPPAPKPVPLTIKVFSILRQADGLTAALDPGAGGGLIYAKVGQRVGELTVTAIDENGIEVETNGRKQRVELRP